MIELIKKIIDLFKKSKTKSVEDTSTMEDKNMKHIKQNDVGVKNPIPELGCFFRCCGLIAEYKTGKSLTVEQINQTWDWAKATVRIDDKDNIRDSASIATRFLRLLGDNGRFIEVGLFKDGVSQYYPAFKNTELSRADALIQKVKTNGKYGTHFRVVGKTGVVVEDPHEPAINSKEIFYSILYAYVAEA